MAVSDDFLMGSARTFSLSQLPIMLLLIGYYTDPQFAMYTTNLVNVTTREMEIEVEDFNASILYLATSAAAAVFGLASGKVTLDSRNHYSADTMSEVQMWDLAFWVAVLSNHVCMTVFMCNPLDWYFLVLVVFGLTVVLMMISRLPLVDGARSRENILLLVLGLLYFMMYTTVRRRGHTGYFAGMLILDVLLLVGHTFDSEPDMQTIGNCRLCYVAGMSIMALVSYMHL